MSVTCRSTFSKSRPPPNTVMMRTDSSLWVKSQSTWLSMPPLATKSSRPFCRCPSQLARASHRPCPLVSSGSRSVAIWSRSALMQLFCACLHPQNLPLLCTAQPHFHTLKHSATPECPPLKVDAFLLTPWLLGKVSYNNNPLFTSPQCFSSMSAENPCHLLPIMLPLHAGGPPQTAIGLWFACSPISSIRSQLDAYNHNKLQVLCSAACGRGRRDLRDVLRPRSIHSGQQAA